jgi:hypothetical protein
MALSSDPRFLVVHALRIKGFAKVADLFELSRLPEAPLVEHLESLQGEGNAQFREARGLWQLTPAGREVHPVLLETDAGRPGFRDGLAVSYPRFLELNEEMKALCGDWQLRDGEPNDHSDATYDKEVIKRVGKLDDHAQKVTSSFGVVAERFAAYPSRLAACRDALQGGQQNMFTGVMCGSYHDVWMELHEDLLLTQSIDRAAEGSF